MAVLEWANIQLTPTNRKTSVAMRLLVNMPKKCWTLERNFWSIVSTWLRHLFPKVWEPPISELSVSKGWLELLSFSLLKKQKNVSVNFPLRERVLLNSLIGPGMHQNCREIEIIKSMKASSRNHRRHERNVQSLYNLNTPLLNVSYIFLKISSLYVKFWTIASMSLLFPWISKLLVSKFSKTKCP